MLKYLQRMKTYDYILATGGGNQFTEVDPSDELDSSSDEIWNLQFWFAWKTKTNVDLKVYVQKSK